MLPRLLPQLDHSNFFRCVCWLVLYTCFSVGNRQSFRTHFLHNYFDGDIYSMFFRASRTIFPSIYSPQLPVWSTPVDFPCVYFVCWFSIVLVFYSALWYAQYFSVVERRQSVYQFSAHVTNLQSLIKRFIFRFKGVFSVPRLRTKGYRLSGRVRHLSS